MGWPERYIPVTSFSMASISETGIPAHWQVRLVARGVGLGGIEEAELPFQIAFVLGVEAV